MIASAATPIYPTIAAYRGNLWHGNQERMALYLLSGRLSLKGYLIFLLSCIRSRRVTLPTSIACSSERAYDVQLPSDRIKISSVGAVALCGRFVTSLVM